MARKHLNTPIDDLEVLFKENLCHRQILGEIRDELTFRTTARAKQLLKEVRGVLSGELRLPDPPSRPDSPEDQLELMGNPGSRKE